jgi:hypothetical protein
MRADIHDGPELDSLQSEAGYIDARPHIRQLDENLLQRTAGPYIGVKLSKLSLSISRPEYCRYCCKSILSILSRDIDSRSGAKAQHRFKEARVPIRSLQISISQSLLGERETPRGIIFSSDLDVRGCSDGSEHY